MIKEKEGDENQSLAAVVSIGTANQGVQALAVSPSMVTVLI